MLEAETRGLISRYIMPVLLLGFLIAVIDRFNIAFAALSMGRDIGIGPEAFGLAAGIFFLGYAPMELPSNYILTKVGAPRWLSRIMITWGLVSAAMALVSGPWSLYLVRFFLGVAEAGFFPGVIYYLTFWYTRRQRAVATGYFMIGATASVVISAPLSGLLLGFNAFGLHGWQWLFVGEAIPAVLLGIALPWLLPRGPETARWLPEANRQDLLRRLADDENPIARVIGGGFMQAIASGPVWILAFAYFTYDVGAYGLLFWVPQIIKAGAASLTNVQVTIYTAFPYLAATIGMLLLAWSSDRSGERRWHLVGLGLLAGVFLLAGLYAGSPFVKYLWLTCALICNFAYMAVFWTVPMAALSGGAAAGGIALIACVGNVAGFCGPYLFGYLREATGQFHAGIIAFAAFFVLSGLVPLAAARLFPSEGKGVGAATAAEAATFTT
jgi:ACS family tartrate transporter-like MFS transporter